MINWINQKYGINLNDDYLTSIKDFALIWSIFEGQLFSNSFSIDKAEIVIQNKEFNLENFQADFEYFKNRYIVNGITNIKFENLYFRRNDRKDFVTSVLLSNSADVKEVVLATTIIIYRIRNNFFHGLKDFRIIEQQVDNFTHANSFLTVFLDYY